MARDLEHAEQCALMDRIRKELAPEFPEVGFLYAVPNVSGKGVSAKMRSIKLKREGLLAGVSDLCLPAPRLRPGRQFKPGGATINPQEIPIYCGLYLEMKRPPDVSPVRGNISRHKPSDDQQKFLDFVGAQGYYRGCANGQDEGFFIILQYLRLERLPPEALWSPEVFP